MLACCSKSSRVRPGRPDRPGYLSCLVLVGLAGGLAVSLAGCTRAYYRKQTDKDVNILYSQKDDKLWKIDHANVYPDPRSRFADPSRPDRPPMPVDDPAAKKLSPNPQLPGKSGILSMEGTGYLDMLKAFDQENRNLLAIREKKRKEEEEARDGKNGKDGKDPKEAKEPKEGEGPAAPLPPPAPGPAPAPVPAPKDQEAEGLNQVSQQIPLEGTGQGTAEGTEYADPRGNTRLRSIIDAELSDPIEPCKPIEVPESSRFNRRHPFLINLEQTVELAVINSREFQARRESLYLASLPVTQERFALSPQLFTFGNDYLNKFGRNTQTGPLRQWSTNAVAGVAQVFCTGAVMLFSFANQTVYNFGQIPSTSVSTISLDIVQPFLRAGGFAVTLEPLTQAERNLLYEIRDFWKFRQEFFVFIAAGQAAFIPGVTPGVLAFSGGTVTAPNAPLITSQGTTPLLGTAIGAPPVLTGPPDQSRVLPGSGGLLFPISPPGATPQGFMQTINEKAQLVVIYQNIDAVRRFLQIFRVYLEGGIVALAQVNQVEQQLLTSIENALNTQVSYRISLDQLKFQMGLPQTVDIDLDDEPLEPMFKLIRMLDHLSKDQQDLTDRSSELSGQRDTSRLQQQYRNLLETSAMTRGTQAAQGILQRWADWAGLSDQNLELRLSELRGQRRELLDRKSRNEGKLNEADQKRLEQVEAAIQLGFFERALRRTVSRFWETLGINETDEQLQKRIDELTRERQQLLDKRKNIGPLTDAEQRRLDQVTTELENRLRWRTLRADQELASRSLLHRSFLGVVEEAFDERQRSVGDAWPCLPKVCVGGVDLLSAPEDIALAAMQKAALATRVDLMNYRGQVVDAWREITVAANGLLGFFNVQYHMDASSPNPGYHPLAIGGSHYHQQMIFNWTLPLLRIVERNQYRASLINFQAARRRLMQGEDDVLFQVRIDLRQVRALGNNFHRIQKRAIVLAYQQVDVALQAFSQPQAPAGPATPQGIVGPPSAGSAGGDPAALTQQLLSAQSRLLNAQIDLYNTWIGFLINRMDLFRDMGVMYLDKRGVWLDEADTCDCGPRIPDAGPNLDQSPSGDGAGRPAAEQLPEPRRLPESLPEPRKLPGSGPSAQPGPAEADPAPGQALEPQGDAAGGPGGPAGR